MVGNLTKTASFGLALVFAASAHAASVTSLFSFGQLNDAEDSSAELLHVDGNNDGFLDTGDVIVGYVDIDTVNLQDPGTNASVQWSGIFALEVKGIENQAGPTGDIVFGPWADFDEFLGAAPLNDLVASQALPGTAANGLITDNPALPAGTMVRMWQRNDPPDAVTFNPGASALENIEQFGTGSYTWDLGFADPTMAASGNGLGDIESKNGEGWVATGGGLAFTAAAGINPGTNIGAGQFALSVLSNSLVPVDPHLIPTDVDANTGVSILDAIGGSAGDMADVTGNSPVKGASGVAASAGFDALNNAFFQFVPVPLPAAAWPGLVMLAGMGIARMRRRQAAC